MRQQTVVIILLCFLYYLQGIPYGIQVKSLPIYYFDVLNYPINFVTKISLLMSPWIFLKPFFAYFLSSKESTSLFLYIGIFASALLNVSLYVIFNIDSGSLLIFLNLFLVNSATVLLDVGTDQLAINSAASVNDLTFFGISNSIQLVAYKLGAMLSGFILFFVGYGNTDKIFLLLSTVYFLGIIILFMLLPKSSAIKLQGSSHPKLSKSRWISNMLSLFSSKSNLLLMIYVTVYKLGEIGSSAIYPMLLIEMGLSRDDSSFISSIVCEPISLCASLFGGLLWSVYKPNNPVTSFANFLSLLSVLRAVPIALQTVSLIPDMLPQHYLFALASCSSAIMSLLGGMVSTLTFTLMMMQSCKAPKHAQATHYAFFSSLEVSGKLLFSSYVGTMNLYLGNFYLYVLFFVLIFVSSAVLKVVFSDSDRTEKYKE